MDMDADRKKGQSRKTKRESDAAQSTKGRRGAAKKEPKKKPGAGTRMKNGNKSKDMQVESEDEDAEAEGEAEAEAEGEAEEDAGPSKKASPPPTKKVKRDKGTERMMVSFFVRHPCFWFRFPGSNHPPHPFAQSFRHRLLSFSVIAGPNADFISFQPEAAKVRDWRHKLQKALLSKTVPTVLRFVSFCFRSSASHFQTFVFIHWRMVISIADAALLFASYQSRFTFSILERHFLIFTAFPCSLFIFSSFSLCYLSPSCLDCNTRCRREYMWAVRWSPVYVGGGLSGVLCADWLLIRDLLIKMIMISF
jgi:hypothetical protein